MGQSEEKKRVDRARRLLELIWDLHHKSGELIMELEHALAGELLIGDMMRRMSDYWLTVWESRYGSTYSWQGAKDSAQLKRLLKTIELVDLESRMLRFLKDPDPFYVKDRHSFALFARTVNRFAPERPPAGRDGHWYDHCQHVPPCENLIWHEQQLDRDTRAGTGKTPKTNRLDIR